MTITTPAWDEVTPMIEAAALKAKLQGVTVDASTYANPYEVPVHYVNPDDEITDADMPGIYISLNSMTRAEDREVRGPTNLTYSPPGYPVPSGSDDPVYTRQTSPYHVDDHPIPYNLDFSVAVFTRNQQQRFQIVNTLQGIDYLPPRFGGLEVPEDGTVRTLELLGGPDFSVNNDADGKRLVSALYTVRVAAELNLYQVNLAQRVTQININIDAFL